MGYERLESFTERNSAVKMQELQTIWCLDINVMKPYMKKTYKLHKGNPKTGFIMLLES